MYCVLYIYYIYLYQDTIKIRNLTWNLIENNMMTVFLLIFIVSGREWCGGCPPLRHYKVVPCLGPGIINSEPEPCQKPHLVHESCDGPRHAAAPSHRTACTRAANKPSATFSQSRTFSGLKVPTSAFQFKTLLTVLTSLILRLLTLFRCLFSIVS